MSIKFLSVLLAVRNGYINNKHTSDHVLCWIRRNNEGCTQSPPVNGSGNRIKFHFLMSASHRQPPSCPILHFPLKDPAFKKGDAFNNSEPGGTPPTIATKDPRKLLAKLASQQADSVSFASLAVRWPYGLHNHPWDESAHFWSGAQKSHDTLISQRWYCPSQR